MAGTAPATSPFPASAAPTLDDPFSVKSVTERLQSPPAQINVCLEEDNSQRTHEPIRSIALKGPGLSPELEQALETTRSYQMGDDEVAVAKFLHSKGYGVREIARLMDRGRMSVSRAVRREDARQCLSRHQRRLAEDWVRASRVASKKGLHEPAQAALEAIGAVDRPAAGGKGGGVQVNVGVALPGAGAPTSSSG